MMLLPRPARFAIRLLDQQVRTGIASLGATPRPVVSSLHSPEELAARAARARAATAPTNERRVVVDRVEHPTPDSRRLELVDPLGSFAARPGQFVTLGVAIDGVVHWRAYSVCGDPADTSRVAVVVRHVPGGLVSSHLVGQVGRGDELLMRGPSGRFGAELPALLGTPVVFVAGGVGVTPIWSLVQARMASGSSAATTVILANRSRERAIFASELHDLARRYPELSVVEVLDEAEGDSAARPGPLSTDLLAELVPPVASSVYFVCGPAPMMDAVIVHLATGGVPPERILTESFALGREGSMPSLSDQHVHLARSGTTIHVKAGRTILEAAARSGVTLPSSCQMGGCAACKVRALTGSVFMAEPNCLTASERAAGFVLACVSHPLGSVTLDA